MTINVVFDPILGKLRQSDVGTVSLASGASLPDPIIVNRIQVASSASINLLNLNQLYGSTASIGNLTTNNIANYSTISTNLISSNFIFGSTASIAFINSERAFISSATIGSIGLNTLQWNLTSGATTFVEGQMSWDANQQTTVLGMAGGNVNLALGMELLLPRRVRNSTGSTMPKGTAVYINGVSGNTPTVDRAIATSDTTSAFTIGLTAESIDNNATGWVTTFGELQE